MSLIERFAFWKAMWYPNLQSQCYRTLYEEEWNVEDIRFFAPNGVEIEKAEFIKLYSQIYYYLNRDLDAEEKIERILEHGISTSRDIIDILAWKIGAVATDYEKQTVTNHWGTIQLSGLIQEVLLRNPTNRDAKQWLEVLCEFRGISFAYAITLLYFITKGAYPIYDRFAHIALMQIKSGADFKNIIDDATRRKEFRDSAKVETVFSDYQKNYVRRIKDIFGNDVFDEKHRTNREIDRALWVYGHLFSDSKANKRRTGNL